MDDLSRDVDVQSRFDVRKYGGAVEIGIRDKFRSDGTSSQTT